MLRTRFITAIIAGLIVLGAILLGSQPWWILVWAGTMVGVYEYCALLGLRRFGPATWWAAACVSVILWWFPTHLSLLIPIVMGASMIWPVATRNRITITQSSAIGIGILYLGYGGGSLSHIRSVPHGLVWVFFLLISIWMTDTVAFFVGKRLGGRKLWPSISPSKTISGAIGGVFGGALGAAMWGFLMLPSMDWVVCAALGAVISIAGQFGDLVESAYKRSAGAKDSGTIFPGHGGMLDRVDSLFLASPVLYFMVVHGSTTWFQ